MLIFDCYVSLKGGGLSRHMVQEVNGLFERGYDVKLILQKKEGEFLNQVNPSVKIYDLKYRGLISYFWTIIEFVKILNSYNPDMIISHAWQVDILVYFSTKLTNKKPKFVFYYHTTVESLNLRRTSFSKLRAWFLLKLIIIPYKNAHRVIAVSNASKEGLIRLLKIPEEKVVVNPSFWDKKMVVENSIEPVMEKIFCSETKPPIILGVGSLLPTKNFEFLIKAIPPVLKKIDVHLVIIGDGPQKLILQTLAKKLKIEKNVTFLGFKNNPSKYMKNSDMFILPSIVEGLGKVLLEAMTLGIPIIGTNVGGIPEVLDNGNCGIIVESNNIEELSDAIIQVLSDKLFAKEITQNGFKRIIFYEPDKLIDQFCEILKNI